MRKAIYSRRVNSIEQALKIAEQHNISRSATDVPADELPDSELFFTRSPYVAGAFLKICKRLALRSIWTTFKIGQC
ncbi:lipopolysaccharide biosynthesis protein [Salmonella enterica subsp. enterica serovar Daytona]|uniref:Lipopolysaccharide biosynthesis protein n=1 Tax=Salmonella enterica subsp. enterica serovar Daytona TaxID=1962639 RepID=A0A447JR22_SALET|nr:lipopolysaccharide biosynthesis protein [Salmonella enterica subsp. enterica serovar Daytona]